MDRVNPGARLSVLDAIHMQPEESVALETVTRAWDAVADEWAGSRLVGGTERMLYLYGRDVLRLIGDVRGKRVLDVGCGVGDFHRHLDGKPAHLCGVDVSQKMIDIARDNNADLPFSCDYVAQDAASFDASEPFDCAVSIMSLKDAPGYRSVLSRVRRALSQGGRFVFVVYHPAFVTPNSGWQAVVLGKDTRWAYEVDQYNRCMGVLERWQPIGWDATLQLWHFHRPIMHYVQGLGDAGFVIDRMEERSSFVRGSDELGLPKIPMFLLVRAVVL